MLTSFLQHNYHHTSLLILHTIDQSAVIRNLQRLPLETTMTMTMTESTESTESTDNAFAYMFI